MKISMAYVTFANKKDAEKISEIIIKEDYAKCVNIFKINSMYKWKNKVNKDNEYVCIYKMKKTKFSKFKKKMQQIHPYEVPCIIEISPNNVNEEYAKWLGE